MTFCEEFKLLLRARYSLIYIPTHEEERLEAVIREQAAESGNRQVYTWDFVDGYQGNPNDAGFARRNPLQALEFVEKLHPGAPTILILRDFYRFLDDVAISRKLRNLARLLKSQPKNIILLSPRVAIPDDLTEVLTVVEFPLPSAAEIQTEIQRLLTATNNSLPNQILNELVRSAQGLSMERIRRVLSRAIAQNGELQSSDVELVLQEKRQTIRQTQILDFIP
ncbi:MAG: AAA family ATPase, partial [Rivularia sp. (in: cyanobacteria)]